MISFTDSSTMIDEAKKAKKQFNPFINVLISIVLIIVSQILTILPSFIVGIMYFFTNDINKNLEPFIDNNPLSIWSLFLTGFLIIICIFYCTRIEKRSLRSMGVIKKGFFKQYSLGLIIGFSMFSAVILILIMSGNISFTGLSSQISPIILIFFLGYLIQGASEEFLCRGFLLNSIAARNGAIVGIIVNSVFFSALHLLNPGFTFLPFLNIILVGLFFSIYAYRTDNIIGACAIHSMWNFAQGNIYGLSVSGTHLTPSLLHINTFNNCLLSGGKFGAEGGVACTIVLLISIVLTLYMPKKSAASKVF